MKIIAMNNRVFMSNVQEGPKIVKSVNFTVIC